VSFPIFQKIDVNGENVHPLYQYLREQAPKDSDLDKEGSLYKFLRDKMPDLLEGSKIRWNFTKFLIDQNGNVLKRFAPTTKLEDLAWNIEKLLVKSKN
jgi:glutathione peroxidase